MSSSDKVRVYYLASGRLGIPVLDALRHDTRFELVGVGSQPDRPGGRKQRPVPTPIAAYAQAKELEVDKPASVNTAEFHDHLRKLGVDLLVVASFGQLLKAALLDLPRLGCLNVHASLLPRHRGASPINQAILDGDHITGISFMKMDIGLDTGPVYQKSVCAIEPTENAVDLEDKLGRLAAEGIGRVIVGISDGTMAPEVQPEEGKTYAKKIRKGDGAADWFEPADLLARKVRAYTPWPSVFAMLPTPKGLKRILITSAEPASCPPRMVPGTVLESEGKALSIACGDGALRILKLVPEGKNEMNISEFLRGNPVQSGIVLPACAFGDELNR